MWGVVWSTAVGAGVDFVAVLAADLHWNALSPSTRARADSPRWEKSHVGVDGKGRERVLVDRCWTWPTTVASEDGPFGGGRVWNDRVVTEISPDETITVVGLDHVVFAVDDVERSLAFYCGELGLEPVRVDQWRRREAPFPSVRVDATTIIDLLGVPRTGENVNHVCLVVAPADFEAIKTSGRFGVVDGPARRYGAQGEGTSLYIRDPDGNTIELRYYDDPS
jgi:catechol 2,3-dioxygenase-like lactoylglutathione lyase family enzyme